MGRREGESEGFGVFGCGFQGRVGQDRGWLRGVTRDFAKPVGDQ